MKIVDACNKEEIAAISAILAKRYSPMYSDIWRIGLNLSLRIGDLLAIQYNDLDMNNRALTLTEAKTGKTKHIRLNSTALAIIAKRRAAYPADTWLFEVHSNRSNNKPISRVSVSRVFKEAGDWLGLHINTHSLRKSRGKAMFDDGVPIEKISLVLNHSSPAETLRYIGINKAQVLQTFDDYEL